MFTPRRAVLGIFLVALLLRGAYVREISAAPFLDLRLGDAEAYHEWALRIAGGEWLGHEIFYQAPLYPYVLASIYKIAGDSTTAVRIVQAIVGASSCALLASAGISLFGPAGAVAGLLLALFPTAIFFDGLLEKTSLVVFLTCALLAVLAVLPERFSAWHGASAGIILGLLILTRENAVLLVPVVATCMWLRPLPGSNRRQRAAAAFAAGILIVLLPVGLRNWAVGGEVHLTTSQFGPNFYIGNHAGATGTYEPLVPGHGSAADERQDATRLAVQAAGHPLGPADVSNFWTRRALADIRARPAEWLRLAGCKLALTFSAVEIADTESRDVYAESSRLLRVLSPFGFDLLIGLAAFGAVVSAHMWRQIWWLYAITATYAVSVALFYVLERYRIPIVPALMVVAAGALSNPHVRPWRGTRTAVAVGAAILVFACARVPLAHEYRARATHYSAIAGVLSRDPGRLAEAVHFYERALDDDDDAPAVQFGLGTVLVKIGRADEAIPHLRAAVRLRPDYAEAHYNLGLALAATGRAQEAVGEYEAALGLRPGHADTRLALAKALLALDQPARAAREYEHVLAADEKSVRALLGIGISLTKMGQTEEALDAYRRALQIDPNEPDVHNNIGFTLAQSGRLAEAMPHFERALALNPRDENARRNLDRARQILRSR
jgi:tetratricopeptide (TPR) repeat protein